MYILYALYCSSVDLDEILISCINKLWAAALALSLLASELFDPRDLDNVVRMNCDKQYL